MGSDIPQLNLPRKIRVAPCCPLATRTPRLRISSKISSNSYPTTIRGLSSEIPKDASSNWPITGQTHLCFDKQALEITFLTTTEHFGSPLNYSITGGIIYSSVFPEDETFGAIINSFLCRWTDSCISYPEYEPADMLQAVLHALASFECTETIFLVVVILPV